MRPVRSRGSPVQPLVDSVQLLAQVAPHVEPPVAHEHRLAELRAVGTQKRRLSAIYVTIVPRLTPCVHIREKSWVRLVVAVEVRVRHHGQYRVVRARFACIYKENKNIIKFDVKVVIDIGGGGLYRNKKTSDFRFCRNYPDNV